MADSKDVKYLEQELTMKLSESIQLYQELIEVAKQAGKDDNYIESLKQELATLRNL